MTDFFPRRLWVDAKTSLFCLLFSCKMVPSQSSDVSAFGQLPCRQSTQATKMTFNRGEPINIPIRWTINNAICEANVFKDQMETVIPIKRPGSCLDGPQDKTFEVTFAQDFPGCESEEDDCVLQILAQSDEPRTYTLCIDFKLNPRDR